MHYALNYRLRSDVLAHDRVLLTDAYRELATLRPNWLACETFRLDDQTSMIFLIEVEQVDWLDHAPLLSAYLQNLAERCEGEPRAGYVDRPSIDVTDAHEIGLWDPTRGTSTVPPAHRSAALQDRHDA